jgi:hypothetical protein
VKRRPTRGYRAEAARCRREGFCLLWGALGVLGAAVIACAPPAPKGVPPLPIVATPISPAPPAPPEPQVAETGAPPLEAALVERVPEGTFGPYMGSAPDGHSIAVWAALAEKGWRWFCSPLDEKGAPLGRPRDIGEAPSELSLATVTGTASGYIVLATGVTPTGTRVEALQLGPTGELLNGPTPLVHSRTEVLWLKALQVGGQNMAMWASLGVGAADLQLVPLNPRGAQQTQASRVLEGAKAWQAVEYSDGVALAAVSIGADDGRRTLLVTFLDNEARSLGQSVIRSSTGLLDQVDLARVGDNLVVSWAEKEGVDERLYLAALGPDTHLVAPPEPASRPFGRQRLIELLPAADPRNGALLAFEHVGQAPRGERRVQIARLTDRARLEPTAATLTFAGSSPDELELTRKGKGLAALTRAVVCARGVTPCATPDPVPTFVELNEQLEVVATEPVRLGPESGKAADLAWGLHCNVSTCSALGALPSAPVPIYGVELRARSQNWLPVASRAEETKPRATEMRAVAETEPLADIGAARVSGGQLVATLSQFDDSTPFVRPKAPAPDGKLQPVRALLGVQVLSSDGRGGAVRVHSYRARAASGIALTRLSDERALLVWTALDRGHPEVFATLLGRDGQPMGQRMLTSNAGDVSALAATRLDKGSLVAWIGNRDGEPRLFAARLNEELLSTAPEQRSSTAGGFTGLSLARHADEAWLASTRHEEREEILSVTRLDPKTGARRGEEIPIQRSETSTLSSPSLAARGDRALLGWVERPLMGGDQVARAWLVELDAEAHRIGEPVAVASKAGDPAALRLACEGGQCQGVIDARPPDGPLLEGFSWQAGAAPEARALVRRAIASTDTPALVIGDGALFYADRTERRGLLRRLGINWR